MWNELTSIEDKEVVEIKNIIQESNIVDEEIFHILPNLDIVSGAVHCPIIFIIDTSKSLKKELKNLNKAIYNFVNDIYKSKTALSASIDFCMVTFNNKVKVKRSFGYISEQDFEDNCKACCISQEELFGKTSMASALFVAWYLAEKRKKMYQELGIKKYKQPIFVLISDLGNNELTKIGTKYLIHQIIELINKKGEKSQEYNTKLALLKALYGNVSTEYDDYLNGIKLNAPENFGTTIQELFSKLISTIDWELEKETTLFLEEDEEDNYVFIPKTKEELENTTNNEINFDLFTNMSFKH